MTPEERAEEAWWEIMKGKTAGMMLVGPEPFGKAVAAAIREAVRQEREACIKATCEHCAAGNEAFQVEGVWVHAFFRGDKESRGGCLAEAIRSRPPV